MNKAMRRDILLLLQEAASVLEGTFGKDDGLAGELRDMHRQMLAFEPYSSSPMSKARVAALNKLSRSDSSKETRARQIKSDKQKTPNARWGRTPEERATLIEEARKRAAAQRRSGGQSFGHKDQS